MKQKIIYLFIGTTAELIKLAPVIKEIKERKIACKIISSGQGKLLFSHLPDGMQHIKVDLGFTGKINQSSVLHFLFWAIKTFFVSVFFLRKEFVTTKKDDVYFIVHGDTVSSLIGSLIATFYRLTLVHIESGLRSHNFLEPFPEEICRYIISHLAKIHFCPNEWAINNLKQVKGAKINTKQNTLIETFHAAIRQKHNEKEFVKKIKGEFYVLVMHRQEHVIFGREWTENILSHILKHSKKDLHCVLLTHETTVNFLKASGAYSNLINNKNISLVERLSYPDFMNLLSKSEYVITDGGSNQEELYYMGKPCLILRKCTERIEGLGENAILSHGDRRIINNFIKNYKQYKKDRVYLNVSPSRIIVDFLEKN